MNPQFENSEGAASQNPEPEIPMDSFNKILVAVDYSDATSRVFEQGMQLAKTYRSRLMIFHCIQERMTDKFPGFGIAAYIAILIDL